VAGLRPLARAVAAAALLLGAACDAGDSIGGSDPSPTPASNGVADKAPAEILRLATDAFRKAGSVRVKGNGTTKGSTFAIDMRMKGTGGGRGTVTVQHNLVEILRIGKDAYLKGDADFWKQQTGNAAAAELLKGKYLKAPGDAPNLQSVLLFTHPGTFADKTMKAAGVVTKGEQRTVAGVQTVGLTFTALNEKVTLYVATTGKPYPMQLSTTGAAGETSSFDFIEYDKPLDLKPPPADQVVDTSKLDN
jgi:hypothetical protein